MAASIVQQTGGAKLLMIGDSSVHHSLTLLVNPAAHLTKLSPNRVINAPPYNYPLMAHFDCAARW